MTRCHWAIGFQHSKETLHTAFIVNCIELHKECQTACYGLQSGSHSILSQRSLLTCDHICNCYYIIVTGQTPWRKTTSVPCHEPYIISVVHIQIFLYSQSKFGFKMIYEWSLSVQTLYSRPCFTVLYFPFSSNVVIWVVVCFTAAKLSILHFLCWVLPCPKMQTFSFSGFCMTRTCCLHNFMIK
jgi:hypothetical protein